MSLNTKDFLLNSLILSNSEDLSIVRNGKLWRHVAGFRKCGCIFAIYKDEFNYCVHSDYEWKENEEPNMGYFDINLSYDELITEVANRYDNIRTNPY